MPRVSKRKIGILQTLVTDYENGRLRLTAVGRKASRKGRRRLEQIEALPGTQQSVLLRTIDTFLEKAALKSARRA